MSNDYLIRRQSFRQEIYRNNKVQSEKPQRTKLGV